MIQKTILALLLILVTSNSFSQIKAITETGDEVLLYNNNTWRYLNDSIKISNEITTNELTFEKDNKSTFLVKSKKLNVGVSINPKKWSFKKSGIDDETEFSFQLRGEELYAMALIENTEIPLLNLRDIAIENAKAVAQDITVDKQEYRNVNGKKILLVQMSGVTQGIKFTYYSYYYSSKNGVVQLVSYTSKNLFEKYKNDMELFLNGLTELKE